MARDIAIVPNRPANMSALSMFIAKRLPLPKIGNEVDLQGMKAVWDSDRVVGKSYYTRSGHQVKVLTKELAFMGWMSMVEYSNGAIRFIGPNEDLFSPRAA